MSLFDLPAYIVMYKIIERVGNEQEYVLCYIWKRDMSKREGWSYRLLLADQMELSDLANHVTDSFLILRFIGVWIE